MSKAINSPTGRLLRSSRLFSLPPPLPEPALTAITSSGVLRSSDTATLPYPIRQAITTPQSSRHRGDWGLKRALPQRSTRSSTPHLRINAIDNLEHITDFDSAADHTQNLAKWQEMNIPMIPRVTRKSVTNVPPVASVFDDNLDNTAFDVDHVDGKEANVNHMDASAERARLLRNIPKTARMRWKTEGPWVGGMSEDDFQQFLNDSVKKRTSRKEFIEFLRHVKMEAKRKEETKNMREHGLDEDVAELEKRSQVDDVELQEYVKHLRDNHSGLSSELPRLIQEYFDLPPTHTEEQKPTNSTSSTRFLEEELGGASLQDGPPATHPSAGISYLRTNAYLENHPLYNAQMFHTPIEARIVRPRSIFRGDHDGGGRALIGVGGFVAGEMKMSAPSGSFRSGQYGTARDHSLERLNPELEGGGKIWVHPLHATVDEKGHVLVEVAYGEDQAIQVKTGEIDPNASLKTSPAFIMDSLGSGGRMEQRLDQPRAVTLGKANYGKALRDMRPNSANRVKGFDDEEIKKMRQRVGGQQGEQNAVHQIQSLLESSRKGVRSEEKK